MPRLDFPVVLLIFSVLAATAISALRTGSLAVPQWHVVMQPRAERTEGTDFPGTGWSKDECKGLGWSTN